MGCWGDPLGNRLFKDCWYFLLSIPNVLFSCQIWIMWWHHSSFFTNYSLGHFYNINVLTTSIVIQLWTMLRNWLSSQVMIFSKACDSTSVLLSWWLGTITFPKWYDMLLTILRQPANHICRTWKWTVYTLFLT